MNWFLVLEMLVLLAVANGTPVLQLLEPYGPPEAVAPLTPLVRHANPDVRKVTTTRRTGQGASTSKRPDR